MEGVSSISALEQSEVKLFPGQFTATPQNSGGSRKRCHYLLLILLSCLMYHDRIVHVGSLINILPQC